jgi:ATP/maltotriose-dependent transcriptional regulator MalT
MFGMDLLDASGVTSREREVLALLKERLTNAEIADRLFIAVRTVESHVSSLLTKLGAEDRRQLAGMADQLERSQRPHNLPRLPSSFVGRNSELAELQKLIRGSRLVTVVGPAGVGKTRLTLQAVRDVSEDLPDGVWFVELAPLDDPDLVTTETIRILGCSPVPQLTPFEALVGCAGSKQWP